LVSDTGETSGTSGTALAERRKRRWGVVLLMVAALLAAGALAMAFSSTPWVRLVRLPVLIPALGCWIAAGERFTWPPARHSWVPLLGAFAVLAAPVIRDILAHFM
jgi:hypothetical protein